jgi:hypothetical protein
MESGSNSGQCSPSVNARETQTQIEDVVTPETFVERSRRTFYSRQIPVSKAVETCNRSSDRFASKSTEFSFAITHEQVESAPGVVTKEDAIGAVSAILKGDPTTNELRDFRTIMLRPGVSRKTRTLCYDRYLLLCYKNTLTHVGWAVCPYFRNGSCPIDRATRKFDPASGGTTSWKDHIESHESGGTAGILKNKRGREAVEGTILPRNLGAMAKNALAMAAARAVFLDLRPISFAEPARGFLSFLHSCSKKARECRRQGCQT